MICVCVCVSLSGLPLNSSVYQRKPSVAGYTNSLSLSSPLRSAFAFAVVLEIKLTGWGYMKGL